MIREETKRLIKNAHFRADDPLEDFDKIIDDIFTYFECESKAQLKAKVQEIEAITQKFEIAHENLMEYKQLAEDMLKAKDQEIERLKADNALLIECVNEAIKRPMGVEPSIYSDYKHQKTKE